MSEAECERVPRAEETSPFLKRFPPEIRNHIYGYVLGGTYSLNKGQYFGSCREKHNMAILRTNKQINQEAVAEFYKNAELFLDITNIVHADFVGEEDKDSLLKLLSFFWFDNHMGMQRRIWRHSPLLGIGKTDEAGKTTYDEPSYPKGLLEPHIFAKFQHFRVILDMNFDTDIFEQFWAENERDEIDDRFNKAEMEVLCVALKKSLVMKYLARILQNCETVKQLVLDFEPFVWHTRPRAALSADRDPETGESDYATSETGDDEIETFCGWQYHWQEDCCLRNVFEILLSRGFFEPLTKLSNIKHFQLLYRWEFEDKDAALKQVEPVESFKDKVARRRAEALAKGREFWWESDPLEIRVKYQKLYHELTATIEGNFKPAPQQEKK